MPDRGPRLAGEALAARHVVEEVRLVGRRSADEILLECPPRRGRAIANSCLRVDVLDVVADGLGGDPEAVGDLAVGAAVSEREQNLQLAPAQAGVQYAGRLELHRQTLRPRGGYAS